VDWSSAGGAGDSVDLGWVEESRASSVAIGGVSMVMVFEGSTESSDFVRLAMMVELSVDFEDGIAVTVETGSMRVDGSVAAGFGSIRRMFVTVDV
jgi:hypothetical protein